MVILLIRRGVTKYMENREQVREWTIGVIQLQLKLTLQQTPPQTFAGS